MTLSRGHAEGAVGDRDAALSMAFCHKVTRARAKNFYYGMKLTSEPKRSALYAIYAFMRACDDLVDEPVGQDEGAGGDATGSPSVVETEHAAVIDPAVGRARIDRFRAAMQRVIDGHVVDDPRPAVESVWPAFRHVMRTYDIDPAHLHAMLDGQAADLVKSTYDTFDELYEYCFRVASTVGLVCISVWGYEGGEATRKIAEERGIALQLTNILRDVVEDATRDRIYLPSEDLKKFGCDPACLKSGTPDAAFDALMRFQLDRAQRYYQQSAGLEPLIAADCRGASWGIMAVYRDLFHKIDRDPRAVLRGRVSLSKLRKMNVVLRAKLGLY